MKTATAKSKTDALEVKVEVSKDYSEFKKLKGNRDLNESNVERIASSMKKLFIPIPIVVNEFMEVIDGQHRLAACKLLGLPVAYIQKKGLSLKDVILLNHDQRKWSNQNYIDAHAANGIESFHTIQNIQVREDYKILGIWHIIAILTDTFRRVGGGDFKKHIEEGTLQTKIDAISMHQYLARMTYTMEVLKGEKVAKDDISFSFLMLMKVKQFDEKFFFEKLRINKQLKDFLRDLYFYSGTNLIYHKIVDKWNELFPKDQIAIEVTYSLN